MPNRRGAQEGRIDPQMSPSRGQKTRSRGRGPNLNPLNGLGGPGLDFETWDNQKLQPVNINPRHIGRNRRAFDVALLVPPLNASCPFIDIPHPSISWGSGRNHPLPELFFGRHGLFGPCRFSGKAPSGHVAGFLANCLVSCALLTKNTHFFAKNCKFEHFHKSRTSLLQSMPYETKNDTFKNAKNAENVPGICV